MADAPSNIVNLKPRSVDELIEWLQENRTDVQSYVLCATCNDGEEPSIFEARGWSGDNSHPYTIMGSLTYMVSRIADEEIER